MNEYYLNELNVAQRQAVENIEGPSLIIAGAGSGKTKVLTCRIARMLESGIAPYSILALTFTNKAAKEMKERVARLVGDEKVRYLWMGTFHSVFARILRSEASYLGFPEQFTIYDKSDSKSAIRACIKELQLDEKIYVPGDVMNRISMAKNNLCSASAYAQDKGAQETDAAAKRPRIVEVYALYAKKCKLAGAMDFDDILLYTNILMSTYPAVLEKYRQKFRYILVDEYQDTNLAQYLIVKNMALMHKNLAVVGDDSQSIYAFRGARIENIFNFKVDFPQAKEFRLEQNYRSTQTVVNAANSVIRHNTQRLPKECFSRSEIGEKIDLIRAYTDTEEAFLVVSSLQSRAGIDKVAYDQFAILYRTNSQSRALEEALRRRNVPYKVFGGFSFYERAEVKDFMAYLRLVINPRDDEAFKRVINVPARGIGATSEQKLVMAAVAAGKSCMEFIGERNLEEAGLKGAIGLKMKEFSDMIQLSIQQQREGANAFDIAMDLGVRSGYVAALKADVSIDGKMKLENVEELLNSIRSFCGEEADQELPTEVSVPDSPQGQEPTLDRFLTNVALLTGLDDSDEKQSVRLMTVHAAKGLEFPYVYVVGMEEQLFPALMGGGTFAELEEERRLFYVAMTRAKTALTLSYAQTRLRWGKTVSNPPSRFLKEIDPKFLSRPISASLPEDDSDVFSRGRGWSNQAGKRFGGGNTSPRSEAEIRGFNRPTPVSATHRPMVPVRSTPTPVNTLPEDPAQLTEGMRVVHDRFGAGRILKVEGVMPNTKAIIEFETGGCKTLLLKFAKLKRLQ